MMGAGGRGSAGDETPETMERMNRTRTIARWGLAAPALALGILALPLRADDPKRPQGRPDLPLPGVGEDTDDPHVEMARLIGKIESDLREIDRLLSEASAGGGSAARAGDKVTEAIAGIDELLAASERRGNSVVEAIDKLFELADHPHEPGGT